jgi:hypothetical protein
MKKSKKSGSKQEAVPLRKWTKAELVPEDWDFRRHIKIFKGNLHTVYLFELDRELGSGTESLIHWPVFTEALNDNDWQKNLGFRHLLARMGLEKKREMDEVPLSEIAQIARSLDELSRVGGGIMPPTQTLHAFLIDWNKREAQVVRDFRAWLKNDERHPGRKCSGYKPGRAFDPRAALWKLGAYRLCSAGYTRKQAFKMLGKEEKEMMSPQNWAAAKRFVKQEILDRLKGMQSQNCDWRSEFVSCILTEESKNKV